jgi:hypothetical protein
MDLAKVLVQLRSELANLDAAIESLERLRQIEHRRGRPPAWLAPLKKKRGRPPGSGNSRGPGGGKRK